MPSSSLRSNNRRTIIVVVSLEKGAFTPHNERASRCDRMRTAAAVAEAAEIRVVPMMLFVDSIKQSFVQFMRKYSNFRNHDQLLFGIVAPLGLLNNKIASISVCSCCMYGVMRHLRLRRAFIITRVWSGRNGLRWRTTLMIMLMAKKNADAGEGARNEEMPYWQPRLPHFCLSQVGTKLRGLNKMVYL